MTLRSNLTQAQRKVLQELKQDDSIIICPADKGKAVVVEDRDTYLAKTEDQIHEGQYERTNKKEKNISPEVAQEAYESACLDGNQGF